MTPEQSDRLAANKVGDTPVDQPSVQPASELGVQPASELGVQPASELGVQPAEKLGDKLGDKLGENFERRRGKQLLIGLFDGQPGRDQWAELQQWLGSNPENLEEVVDQLLLDSLLREALGTDAVASLVDMVTESEAMSDGPEFAVNSMPFESAPTSNTKTHALADGPQGAGGSRSRAGWLLAFVSGAVVASLVVASFMAASRVVARLAVPSHGVPSGLGGDGRADAGKPIAGKPIAGAAVTAAATNAAATNAAATNAAATNAAATNAAATNAAATNAAASNAAATNAAATRAAAAAVYPKDAEAAKGAAVADAAVDRGGPLHGRSNESTAVPTIAALLVDEVGAKFADGLGPQGVRFGPGAYELLEGIVHLRFAQGADMVLSSPARLEVFDSQRTRLAFGKVRVIAPPTAKGFTIATRAADYVDLGTEFGLRVDPRSGASDLYVFDGQVNVTDPRSGAVLSEVVEGNSSRFVGGVSGTAPKWTANEFPTPGTIGLKRWQEYARMLRRDRGLLMYFPFERTTDEAALVNRSETTASDGQIVGARWTSGRWPGKEALLFDRDDDCVRIEIGGEHQELTIAAWIKIERLDFELNAILNSDGDETGGVHFQLTRQGLPRGGVLVHRNVRETVLGNSVPVGRWSHVASVLSVPQRSQTIYVNGLVAHTRTLRGDDVIRPGACRLGNWLPAPRADFTNRSFRGQVDELAIWRRALTVEEIKRQVEAGRPGLLWNEAETDLTGATFTHGHFATKLGQPSHVAATISLILFDQAAPRLRPN